MPAKTWLHILHHSPSGFSMPTPIPRGKVMPCSVRSVSTLGQGAAFDVSRLRFLSFVPNSRLILAMPLLILRKYWYMSLHLISLIEVSQLLPAPLRPHPCFQLPSMPSDGNGRRIQTSKNLAAKNRSKQGDLRIYSYVLFFCAPTFLGDFIRPTL